MIDRVKTSFEAKYALASLESKGIQIPSDVYVGMQFTPTDKFTSRAMAYSG